MARHRLGVALLLPDPARTEVQALRRALDDPALDRIEPHLTLLPPVNVAAARMGEALALLRRAAGRAAPLRLEIGPPASFLPVNAVLYLAVRGPDVAALEDLRAAVRRPPLERDDPWPWVPHVTVAADGDPRRIQAAVDVLAGYQAMVVLDRLTVLEEGNDRVWRPLADAALERPAVVGTGGLVVELAVSERLDPEAAAVAEREWRAFDLDAYGVAGDDRSPFAVTARRAGEVAGTATGWLSVSTRVAHLSELMVVAEARGTGVGGHLLARVLAVAAEHGCERLTVHAEAGERAERFYTARGFVPECRLVRFRFGRDFTRLVRRL